MINICVPVLRRYDLLRRMLLSLRGSTLSVDTVQVINNGKDRQRLALAIGSTPLNVIVHEPEEPLGIAASWNWFIRNVSEERVITNDDVTFASDSLERLMASKADLIWASGCGFSCFILRDACVQKIGLFDETISPGYGYYEDDDYLQRLDGRGTRAPSAVSEQVDAGVLHLRSQTLATFGPKELEDHHRKFGLAQRNYAKKWRLEKEFGFDKMGVCSQCGSSEVNKVPGDEHPGMGVCKMCGPCYIVAGVGV